MLLFESLLFDFNPVFYALGVVLPFISPFSKYSGMINSATPYTYPGKHIHTYIYFFNSCCCAACFEISSVYFSQLLKALCFLPFPLSSCARRREHARRPRPPVWSERKQLGVAKKPVTFHIHSPCLCCSACSYVSRKSAPPLKLSI